jgi:oxaloacetate decarboxylase gamma subunit
MDTLTTPMLLSGVKLMLIGMGIVFSFLLLLVWIIQRTHRLLQRWEAPDGTVGSLSETLAQATRANDAEVVAAITAAVRLHEQRESVGKELG